MVGLIATVVDTLRCTHVNDSHIASREPEHLKGVKPFPDYDLVNFDQSSLLNELILKMGDCCPRENISAQWAKWTVIADLDSTLTRIRR